MKNEKKGSHKRELSCHKRARFAIIGRGFAAGLQNRARLAASISK